MKILNYTPDFTIVGGCVNFRCDMASVRPRRLWQTLFNLYRANNGDINNMDNMLIDFQNCEKIFDYVDNGRRTARFLWGCDAGHWSTTWINEEAWKGCGMESVLQWNAHDFFVLCELTSDDAKFTVVKKGEDV